MQIAMNPSGLLSIGRLEPWRDWAALAAVNHVLLLGLALWNPGPLLLVLGAVPLGTTLAIATLTVLHDAGHRRLSRHLWVNVIAVQTAAPVGLWVAHWTLKHRVHHRVTSVYPVDDSTRASGMLRFHPSAPWKPVHRFQHVYAWFLYGLAWAGELRSQLTYVRTGNVSETRAPARAWRTASFALEKALCGLVLLPYALLLGVPQLALLLVVAMTLGSAGAGVVLIVGHVNYGLEATDRAPDGRDAWQAHLVRTSASFNIESRMVRWLTGGMTHHLAHHLRATAPRAELPAVHREALEKIVAAAGESPIEYRTLIEAVKGHWRALRELGTPLPA